MKTKEEPLGQRDQGNHEDSTIEDAKKQRHRVPTVPQRFDAASQAEIKRHAHVKSRTMHALVVLPLLR
ncbi:unnamed protein product [Angiostrongylus costaricensis]|uniref:Transposase n=1 Tax=Angiostrongylus costaricensis TaxID=334426 RepID=A0A0R3PZ87_ANGCS|nr:unnamed protein product [Angiostrongylus costaricensis]